MLYEYQLRARVVISQKENKMEKMIGREVLLTICDNWSSVASSKVKGFMWLFWNHALPVGERMYGSEPDRRCPRCGQLEIYKHCALECPWVKQTLDIVATEWAMRSKRRYFVSAS